MSNIGSNFNKMLFDWLALSDALSANAITMVYLCTRSDPVERLQMFTNFFKNLNQRSQFSMWNSKIAYEANKYRNENKQNEIPIEFKNFITNTAIKIQKDMDIIISLRDLNFCHVEVFFKTNHIFTDYQSWHIVLMKWG